MHLIAPTQQLVTMEREQTRATFFPSFLLSTRHRLNRYVRTSFLANQQTQAEKVQNPHKKRSHLPTKSLPIFFPAFNFRASRQQLAWELPQPRLAPSSGPTGRNWPPTRSQPHPAGHVSAPAPSYKWMQCNIARNLKKKGVSPQQLHEILHLRPLASPSAQPQKHSRAAGPSLLA